MKTIKVENGTLSFSNIDFLCPSCGKAYSDTNDKYLNRCNKNKSGNTRIKCSCGVVFYMTYNYMSDAVAFKPIINK
jgi:hypothetical protein